MADPFTFVENIWYFAGFSPQFKRGQMQHKTIACQPIVIGRGENGKIFALRDICPHRAAPLSAGRVIENSVQCPYHGWRFRGDDGQCLEIPSICKHQKDPSSGISVRNYPVREDGNLIWIYLASDKNFKGTPPVEPPQFTETHMKPRLVNSLILEANFDHSVIGLIDPAHVSFLHKQWWWRADGSMHDKTKHFEPRGAGWVMSSHQPSSNSLGYKLLGGKPVTEISFYLPNVRVEHITLGKKTLLSFTVITPITEDRTEITQAFFTNINIVKFLSPLIGMGIKTFLQQDGDMVKLQAGCLEYNPKLMLLGDADMQARWYFTLKKEWALAHAENRPFKNPIKPQSLSWRS
ncbi:MAG: 2Fe-2S ferredoxin [Robiginitomaculum sp.]|nr:MAG: 2Fe-2S ferredoxin [Robiginitomaculum sp.]